MSQSLGSATATLVYYIKLVAAASGQDLNAECHAELNAVIDAFKDADKDRAALVQLLPSD